MTHIVIPHRVSKPEIPTGYEQRLKKIHRGLYFKWNPEGGLTGYWEIWWHNDNTGKHSHAISITQGKGMYYKSLGPELFQTLRAGDSHKIGIKAVIAIAEEQDRLREEAKQKEMERISEEALRDEAQMERLTQKPIGVATEGEYKKPKGRIVG
jgi:hypothetical protein